MDIDPQWIINGLFGLLGICLGYILNNVRTAVASLQAQDTILAGKVQQIEVLVAGQYVKRDDFDRFGERMFAKLDAIQRDHNNGITRIEERLNNKADK